MKAFVAAVLALVVISGIAAAALNSGAFSSEAQTSSEAVRL